MQAFKFLIVVAFAVCSLQANAAEIPKSADKVDLRLFVENGAAIAKTLFKAVNTGLDQAKPNMDKILNELAPEARALIRKYIDESRAKMNEEEKRVEFIFATLTKALDTLKPIKPCSDKVSPAAKKLALATEKEAVKIVEGLLKKYNATINNLKVGAEKTLNKARKLFDTEVAAVVKCLTPGRKDANACLDKEINKILQGASEVISDAILLAQTAQEALAPMMVEALQKFLPLVDKVTKDGRVLLKTLADCVGTLKA